MLRLASLKDPNDSRLWAGIISILHCAVLLAVLPHLRAVNSANRNGTECDTARRVVASFSFTQRTPPHFTRFRNRLCV